MSKRKRKQLPWQVIQITKSPARNFGVVYAPEKAALSKAIEQFGITQPHEQKKLMVRRQS